MGHASYGEPLASPKGRSAFTEFEEEIGEGCFEKESIGREQEFEVLALSYWQGAERGQLLLRQEGKK